MQNLYPLFERNRILKKELLWSLRDYAFAHIQLEYREYGQGIIQGCELQVCDKEIVVGPGMIKYNQFICLLTESAHIPYESAEQVQYLKLRIEINRSSPDSIAYQMELILDFEKNKKENEFELCRFHLRSGAQLRDYYKDFGDMDTEYDTLNLIHADWGGLGGKSISPTITKYFAETVLKNENSQEDDRSFAYLSLNQQGAIPLKVLIFYAVYRSGNVKVDPADNLKIYQCLCDIMNNILRGKRLPEKEKKERHRILVD